MNGCDEVMDHIIIHVLPSRYIPPPLVKKKFNLLFCPYPFAFGRGVQKVHYLFQLYDHYTCYVNMSAFHTTAVDSEGFL